MKSSCIKEGEFIPLNFDMIFKKVFGDPDNTEPLRMLIKVVLDIDAKEITVLNNEILGERLESKKTTVDLIVKLENGTRIGMEMNRVASDSLMLRNFGYITRTMFNGLRHNDKYDKLDEYIQVILIWMEHI